MFFQVVEAPEPSLPHVRAADFRLLRPDGGRLHPRALPRLHPARGPRPLLRDALPDSGMAVQLSRGQSVKRMRAMNIGGHYSHQQSYGAIGL